MQDEFQALLQQHTWDLITKPTNHPIIGSTWVFKIKFDVDGSLAQHKARLVALGNNQEYSENYLDTFSPIAKFATFCILLTLAVSSH